MQNRVIVRRRRNTIQNADRQRIVNCYENGDDFILLADQLQINRDTARSIIRTWMEKGTVNRATRGGALNTRTDQEMINCILAIVQEKPFTTLQNVNDELRIRLPNKPQICTTTISRHLENNFISVKIAGKDADVPYQRNTARTKLARFDYMTWLTNLPVNQKIIYVDETGFNVFTRRRQGRAPIGQRVWQENNNIRDANINIIIAISSEVGLVHFDIEQSTLTHDRYQNFVNQLVAIAAERIEGETTIVHDGARPHLNTIVPNDFQHRFNIRTLPPYSPMLNPVEQANSCFKAHISRALTEPALQVQLRDENNQRIGMGLNQRQWRARILVRLARNALETITHPKCINWCRRVDRYIPQSLAQADIHL